MPRDEEASLIDRLRRQDPEAFQELIDQHSDSLRHLVGRLMAYDPEMEDVLQNTFVQVWRKIGSFRGESSLKTWITRIAIAQTRNQQRSVRRWIRRLQELWKEKNAEAPTPIHKENDDTRWETIQSAMQRLPYRDRELLVLVYLQGFSIQQLAEDYGERANTLEVRLHRTKKLLQKWIQNGNET